MGYKSFAHYMESKCWKAIRGNVMRRCANRCEVCGKSRATVVHWRSYELEVFRGKRPDMFVACCAVCREMAQYNPETKHPCYTLAEINWRLMVLAENNGCYLFGVCRKCRRKTTGNKGKKMFCGSCKEMSCSDWQAHADFLAERDPRYD